MTSFIRQLSFGLLCGGIAFAVAGCSSEDAGKTLTVDFTSGTGLVMSRTTAGSDAEPDVYTGATTVVAKVVYRGARASSLVYKWTYSLPSGISATGSVNDEVLSLEATASMPAGLPLPSGDGWVKLEVYEKTGTQYESASVPLPVFVSFSG